ncbi:peptidylprolyl isomerase [Eleftheria terrae]|uniref:peptidylprolyl isomerase n=1 Tax=Eleftheria terrae TaxID=1597781 RepID=UPI00263B9A11|nr:peptidylprolyl isomerase [Eleftheria terrae]WKB54812.1 peptidylprolyl isomerase [Eleftheria terrae]
MDKHMIEPPSVNGVLLLAPDESLDVETLRQRACSELLRQAAIDAGLLAADDPPPSAGIASEAASSAIEQLLAQQVVVPEPSQEACRRHYLAQPGRWRQGERVQARHILFAVTPGLDVQRLRRHAEQALLELRSEPQRFGERARELSNCPSAADGGQLGWLVAADCAPEFARELFGHAEVGVLPRLVHSRFGLHVVEVLARDPGQVLPFEAVQPAVALALRQQVELAGVRQYLALLAGQARLQGVDLAQADTPLVQ